MLYRPFLLLAVSCLMFSLKQFSQFSHSTILQFETSFYCILEISSDISFEVFLKPPFYSLITPSNDCIQILAVNTASDAPMANPYFSY